MKSLTYFSKFTKTREGDNPNDGGLDIQTLKDTMDHVDHRALDRLAVEDDDTPTKSSVEDEHQQLNES